MHDFCSESEHEHFITGNDNFVSILKAGEMLHVAATFIDKNYHPTVICRGNCETIKRECGLIYIIWFM